ncbi:ribonuclease T2 family protein [Methylomicrobium lacus]|uniref:ribonuclease T2 family protein n=1 Tax=Methylomicrobium lacus TaxID=136992 RepID=UPI00045EC585|nr:hypothetical protein [Methylomicrobium lacus]
MRFKNYLVCLLLAAVFASPAGAEPRKSFDYYVMSLSWSPEFCDTHPKEKQCSLGYGLVLHGLWPQYQRSYPEFCDSRPLPGQLVRKYADLYPSKGLIYHEWEKHGTCSGLAPGEYLQLSETLKQRIKTPPALQNLAKPLRTDTKQLTQFVVAANPGLAADAVAISCTGKQRYLEEIYVCYDSSGAKAISCAEDVQKKSLKSCGKSGIVVRNIR